MGLGPQETPASQQSDPQWTQSCQTLDPSSVSGSEMGVSDVTLYQVLSYGGFEMSQVCLSMGCH